MVGLMGFGLAKGVSLGFILRTGGFSVAPARAISHSQRLRAIGKSKSGGRSILGIFS
ncbi:hypothetical protein NEOLEDRAFT_1141257 [Neolentinus lepideus HHB14362 ss-1]|uniref:Uncharacterized protein n=1 Tax=Neolentinus lepideus HHB14362 ss-1 TaxID=1314782 RepID=A0A165NQH6_9AGAM|nr:hypothetical protein NEOLEDRAFT_1141257 [Neolentinus lepideus HHB14362 ss-1]